MDLAIAQKAAGHDVAFVAADGGYRPLLERYSIPVYSLEGMGGFKSFARLVWKHREACDSFRPDVIHAHMRAGLLAVLPTARLRSICVIGHVHNVQEWQSRFFALADGVISVSASVSESMRRVGIKPKKLYVVTNGPLDSARLGSEVELTPKLIHPSVVTVAGMNERKGISELIEAFGLVRKERPDANLYLVGDGPDRDLFVAKAGESEDAENIHFEGFCKDPRGYMREADVFVLASRRDSGPLVLFEARAAGCAIVASDVDGIPEALDGGRAGVLVPPGNVEVLAAKIVDLLRDERLRKEMADAALLGLEAYSVARVAREVESVYRSVLLECSK